MKNTTPTLNRLAAWWLDRHARAPRGLGFSVDDGLPDRGKRYGGAQTIHNTGTIDVVLNGDGVVTEVWFRCMQLAAHVSTRDTKTNTTWATTGGYDVAGAPIVAVELADPN